MRHPPWESHDRAEVCPDCDAEQLSQRREYEKAEIRRLEDDGGPQDCALEMKWANSWRSFVHNKTDEVPHRVDNRIIHQGNHMLKEDLEKDRDYLMIPSNIWTFLIQIYGGGPKIVPTRIVRSPRGTPQRHRGGRPKHAVPRTPSQGSSRSSKKSSPQSGKQSDE